MFYLCLYMRCHETLKQQKIKLVTVTKGLRYCDNLGEMLRRENREEERGRVGGIPTPTKLSLKITTTVIIIRALDRLGRQPFIWIYTADRFPVFSFLLSSDFSAFYDFFNSSLIYSQELSLPSSLLEDIFLLTFICSITKLSEYAIFLYYISIIVACLSLTSTMKYAEYSQSCFCGFPHISSQISPFSSRQFFYCLEIYI